MTEKSIEEQLDLIEHKLRETFVTEYTRDKWRKVIPYMGIKTDKQLSKKFGFNQSTISSVRRKLNIAPENFERICARYGALFIRGIY